MEPTQDTPPPKRRRRRRLIVTVILLLVSSVAWWDWPRGDARFVGKWACSSDYSSIPWGTMHLYSNGIGTVIAVDPRLMDNGSTFSWQVSGDRFIRGQREKEFIQRGRWTFTAASWIADFWHWQTGYSIWFDFEPYSQRIVEVSDSWIRLKTDDSKGGGLCVLTRIPE